MKAAGVVVDGATGAVVAGVTPGNPGNANLKPERGVEIEGGFDAGIRYGVLALALVIGAAVLLRHRSSGGDWQLRLVNPEDVGDLFAHVVRAGDDAV